MTNNKNIFRPRARIMHLLGDQLIRNAGIAVFELVKNAYDADATKCIVTMHNINNPDKARVTIQDDGIGMTYDIITKVWLEPGTEYRKKQRESGERTKKNRLPLGEKGIGRFAVHKIGKKIKLITRAEGGKEIVINIDWENIFSQSKYLSDISVNIHIRTPQYFTDSKTGTLIEVSDLREHWTRGKVRDLYRSINSICSPFALEKKEKNNEFKATLALKPDPDNWLKGLIDIQEVMDLSLFRGFGVIEGDEVTYDYEFKPLPSMQARIKGRELRNQKTKILGSMPEDIENASPGRRPKQRPINLDYYKIGSVRFSFYIFDRDPLVLELTTSDKAGLKKFLDANGGIRVYRDDVRVYDFGEPGNDWLDLGGRRVNIPVRRISNNQILGAITLAGETAKILQEKTNREGFIENEAYEALKVAILCSLHQIEIERNIDKDRLRKIYRGKAKEPVIEDIALLRKKLKEKEMLDEYGAIIDRIEKQFEEVRDTLLSAAGAGLSLTVVLHEVEKIVKETVEAVNHNVDKEIIKQLVYHISDVVDGLAFLVRSSGWKREKAGILIKQALFNFDYRFRAHGIKVINGMENGNKDFSINCVRRLVVSTLTNLLDNCIYWLEKKGHKNKKIYIGTTEDLPEGLSFVVADNGPGFQPQDTPEYLVQPFFSRKEDGMGLGLHIANEVARIHKGQLLFPDLNDLSLPHEITGAIIALHIPPEDTKG